MYAAVFQVDMKQDWPGDVEAELDELTTMTRSTPGFVRGTWVTDGTSGMSFLLYESEATAREMVQNAFVPPDASVIFRSVDVYEVARDV